MRLLIISREPLGFLVDAVKLCEYAARNHDVTVLTFDSMVGFTSEMQRVRQQLSGVTVRTVPLGRSRLMRFKRWMAACHEEVAGGHDFVYVYHFPGCGLLSLFQRRSTRKRMLLDIRSGSVSQKRSSRWLVNLVIALDARCFQWINVISEGVRNMLRLPRRRTHILPLGADVLDVSPREPEHLHALYLGLVSVNRRVRDTIEAFALFYRATGHHLPMRYTIVGDGPDGERARLIARVRDLGLEDVIRLPGYVPHEQLRPYLEQCNLGVSYIPMTPYFNHQPPTKTFEYLLAGIPVIATATAANRKVVNESNGILISDTPAAFYRGLCEFVARRGCYDSASIRRSLSSHSWENIMLNNALPRLEMCEHECDAHNRLMAAR
jgi:glycosyltransferase involved in cell wall biosynthesis